MLRRSSNYAYAYLANDIILIVLWALTIKNVGMTYIPTVITFVIFFINDIYGLINWKKMEKDQKSKS